MWTVERILAWPELVVVRNGARTHADPPERRATNSRTHGRRERTEHVTTVARRQSLGRSRNDSGAQAGAHTTAREGRCTHNRGAQAAHTQRTTTAARRKGAQQSNRQARAAKPLQ